MDRASDCGSEGCEFESHRAHQWRVGRVVHGDGFENRSPLREAQVRLLYPPPMSRCSSRSSTDRMEDSESSDAGSIPTEGTE